LQRWFARPDHQFGGAPQQLLRHTPGHAFGQSGTLPKVLERIGEKCHEGRAAAAQGRGWVDQSFVV